MALAAQETPRLPYAQQARQGRATPQNAQLTEESSDGQGELPKLRLPPGHSLDYAAAS